VGGGGGGSTGTSGQKSFLGLKPSTGVKIFYLNSNELLPRRSELTIQGIGGGPEGDNSLEAEVKNTRQGPKGRMGPIGNINGHKINSKNWKTKGKGGEKWNYNT